MQRNTSRIPHAILVSLILSSCTPSIAPTPCTADSDCDNAECVRQVCRPFECESDAECTESSVCNENACVECRQDADCELGLLCDGNLCVNTSTFDCLEDADCPSTTLCRDRRCLPSCADTADCRVGDCNDGVCSGCARDSDCGDGVCGTQSCQRSCQQDAECRPDQQCLRERCGAACGGGDVECSGMFTELAIEALASDTLLPLPRRAESGCQASGEAFAAGSCDGPDPYPRPRLCDPCLASLGGCLGTCEGGDCLCEENEDCPGGRVCAEGKCAPCMTTDECACGQFCSYGTCRDACVDDSACAAGFQCIAGQCNECGGGLSCPDGERCYADGCVEPCTTGQNCSAEGRLSICGTFEPFEESLPRQCD